MDEKRKKHSTGPKETARSFVIINGKHVEGIDAEADEIVQAGKVYPIYTFEPNRSEDKWNCSVCDTENSNRNTTCCVCGQAKKNFSNDSTGVGTSTQNQNNGGDLGKNKDNADGINPTRQKSTSKIKWIILGLLLIIAVVGVVYATLIWKNSDESKKLNKPNSSSIVSSSVSTKERNEETSNALSESSMSVSSTVTSEPTSSDSSKSEPASTTSSEVVVYTITYRVSGNGTLSSDGKSGKSSLEYSTSGTASGQSFTVTAVPGTNSQFVRWSDGETKATRTDTNISESKTLTAYFEEKTVPEYSVIYRVSGNGTLNSGNTCNQSE